MLDNGTAELLAIMMALTEQAMPSIGTAAIRCLPSKMLVY